MLDSPQQAPSTHAAIIDRWPSLSEYADDVGISYDLAKSQRRRNSIPDAYRAAVVSQALKRGFCGITFELLTKTAKRGRR